MAAWLSKQRIVHGLLEQTPVGNAVTESRAFNYLVLSNADLFSHPPGLIERVETAYTSASEPDHERRQQYMDAGNSENLTAGEVNGRRAGIGDANEARRRDQATKPRAD